MSVRVFVSSTAKDLSSERREVIEAVRWAGGIEVAMESWDSPFTDSKHTCLRKIRDESTHFLGVFCYYRGWLPDTNESITEIEFSYAREHREREHIAVFVPKQETVFDGILRERARDLQGEQQLKAQKDFIREVLASGVAGQFDSAPNLYHRVQRRVTEWVRGPLHQEQSLAAVSRAAVDDLVRRHFLPQVRATEDILNNLVPPNLLFILVDGKGGHGQKRLLNLLLSTVEVRGYRNREPRRYRLTTFSHSRPPGVDGVLMSLGESICKGWRPSRVAEVAEYLFEGGRADRDVTIIVPNLIDYPRGERGFLADVWVPLADAAASRAGHGRLVCLAVAADGPPTIATDQPGLTVLPPIDLYDMKTIYTWLMQHLPPPADEARCRSLAEKLIGKSNGGLPQLLIDEVEGLFGVRMAE